MTPPHPPADHIDCPPRYCGRGRNCGTTPRTEFMGVYRHPSGLTPHPGPLQYNNRVRARDLSLSFPPLIIEKNPMFGLGTTEMMIVALVVLLLFGNRLPSVMRSLGRGVVEFKKGVSGIDDEVQQVGHEKETLRPDKRESGEMKGEAEHGHSDAAPK